MPGSVVLFIQKKDSDHSKRCGLKDYEIHIEPDTFHAYPVFTFTPEGRKGERQVIDFIRSKSQKTG